MSFPEYEGKTVGFAKIMGELPISDGTLAYEIMNYTATETGFLENRFALMPLIPSEWNTPKDGSPTQPPELSTALAMRHMLYDGECPEFLILTESGVFRFLPSNRVGTIPYGSIETDVSSSNGLVEQFYYDQDNNINSVKPQSKRMFPPQMEVVGNRVYFTYCEGGGAYVWDGTRIMEVGFTQRPSNPYAIGPAPIKYNQNAGGFSDSGRIGTLNYNLQKYDSDEQVMVTTGGIEAGLWYYAVVFENEDGAYSVTSDKSSRVTIQFRVVNPNSTSAMWGIQFLKRRFWVSDLPKGPTGTVARVLLRTMNLNSLPQGETGHLRFLHRVPNNSATEYMDDIPDSELGSQWDHRRTVPIGFFFMKFFNGAMFLLRTERHSARVWWSEQGVTTGSIPESFLHSHWRDVFPETGPITGAFSASINGEQSLLVFKEDAAHYIGGTYAQPGTEGWQFGTISTIAGCAGPNLCQSSPDAQVIWYGNGTFWMLDTAEGGGVIDIGVTIRNRLSKINSEYDQFGVSWVNKKTKEMVFCLPYKDSTKPNLQFVWDYINRGWRLRKDLNINAVEQINDLTILAGSWEGRVGTAGELGLSSEETPATNTLWVYQMGYPNYSPGSDLISTYKSGWSNFNEFGPAFHASQRAADTVFTMEERSARIATVKTFADWDYDVPVADDLELSLVPPENNNIATYSGTDTTQPQETTNTILGDYSSRTSLYRTNRAYTQRLPIDVPSCTVFSVSVSSSCIYEPMALISADAYGPVTSGPGSRSPTTYER